MDIRKLVAIGLAAIFSFQLCAGRDLKFHGPILQWHRDPAHSVTFTWVESLYAGPDPQPEWRDGKSGFGYGDDDDVTVFEDMEGGYERVYLARNFFIDEEGIDRPVRLVIDYDDAFVAWINGIEVARSPNLEGYYTHADVKGGHEAGEPEVFEIQFGSDLLVEEDNLIAIEVHNVRKSSSDLTIRPELIVGEEKVISLGDEWRYLAGADPDSRWFLTLPAVSPEPELPKKEESSWEIGIRPKGSIGEFEKLKIQDRQFGESDDRVFSAQADNLAPATAYEYVLATGEVVMKSGWFVTAPDKLTVPIRFVVGGDMGTTEAVPVCKLAGRVDPLFALIGGDLAYANGRDSFKWFDWIDNWSELVVGADGRDIPGIFVIGNHEMKGLRIRKEDAPYYFSLFDLPANQSNFSVDFGDYMSVIALDSDHAQKVESQTFWLRTQLATRKKVPHLFVTYHRPAWGTGVKRNIGDIQDDWCPLFEEFGVDCVFENDHHVYKRTHKITDGMRDEENGVLYLGDGAWGAHVRPITDRMLRRVGGERYLASWEATNHLIQTTIFPDGSRLYEATRADGSVFDSYRDESPAIPE